MLHTSYNDDNAERCIGDPTQYLDSQNTTPRATATTPALMRMHACTHTCACTYIRCIRAHTHTCTHAPIHTCTHSRMQLCTHAHLHTCTHANLHTCTPLHMHTSNADTCTHTHMHHACTCTHHMHACKCCRARLHMLTYKAHAHMHACMCSHACMHMFTCKPCGDKRSNTPSVVREARSSGPASLRTRWMSEAPSHSARFKMSASNVVFNAP